MWLSKSAEVMKILITGANGFIGKNLKHHLVERNDVEIVCFTQRMMFLIFPSLEGVEFVFHLAGVNRPYSLKSLLSVMSI